MYTLSFLFLLKNIDCGYSLEPPCQVIGVTSTHNLCFVQKYENYRSFFLSENFHFLEVKFSLYLNRRVFVYSKLPVSIIIYIFIWWKNRNYSIYPIYWDRQTLANNVDPGQTPHTTNRTKHENATSWTTESANKKRNTITKTRLFKYIENFTNKNWKFSR